MRNSFIDCGEDENGTQIVFQISEIVAIENRSCKSYCHKNNYACTSPSDARRITVWLKTDRKWTLSVKQSAEFLRGWEQMPADAGINVNALKKWVESISAD